jgi:hypothetical protein
MGHHSSIEGKPFFDALYLDPRDTVATVVRDIEAGETIHIKGIDTALKANDAIPYGHKIAVASMCKNDDIIKYGQCIGLVITDTVLPGSWVHLHNMESAYDAGLKKRIGR